MEHLDIIYKIIGRLNTAEEETRTSNFLRKNTHQILLSRPSTARFEIFRYNNNNNNNKTVDDIKMSTETDIDN